MGPRLPCEREKRRRVLKAPEEWHQEEKETIRAELKQDAKECRYRIGYQLLLKCRRLRFGH